VREAEEVIQRTKETGKTMSGAGVAVVAMSLAFSMVA